MNAGQLGAGTRQLPRNGAEAQQEAVVDDFLAIRQGNPAGGRVEADRPGPQLQFDAVLVVERLMSKRQPVGCELAGQEFLRQRRPLIRQFPLLAHQDDPALEALAPQGVDGLRAGLAAAYDEDRGGHGQTSEG